MSHEERPNFIKILDDIKSCSVNTSTSKTNWENQTQEEIIKTIREGAAELYRRGVIKNPIKIYEHQLGAIKSLEYWHSGKIKQIPDMINIDSMLFNQQLPSPLDEQKQIFAFRNLFPSMEPEFKKLTNRFHTQYTIEELQKILQKHPNRTDVRMELMKLQKENKTKYIGRPKRKKKK